MILKLVFVDLTESYAKSAQRRRLVLQALIRHQNHLKDFENRLIQRTDHPKEFIDLRTEFPNHLRGQNQPKRFRKFLQRNKNSTSVAMMSLKKLMKNGAIAK